MIRAATDECMIDAYRYTIWQDLVSEQDRSA
jgi:hypothetical protein